MEEQRLSQGVPGRSIFDFVSVNNGHQTIVNAELIFPRQLTLV
jgi:hypothetical protein